MFRPSNSAPRTTVLRLAGALALPVVLAAPALSWEDYFDRSDSITHFHGDAIATNRAIQQTTRWPRASQQDYWLSDGERARTAIVRYKTGKVIPPRTLSGKQGASGEMPPTPETPVQAGPAEAASK